MEHLYTGYMIGQWTQLLCNTQENLQESTVLSVTYSSSGSSPLDMASFQEKHIQWKQGHTKKKLKKIKLINNYLHTVSIKYIKSQMQKKIQN